MPRDALAGFFDRDEVLAGLPAKRAAALLFLIESRTAHLVARSRRALDPFLTDAAAEERELAFLEAFALGRDPPLRPTIQDLERHAADWAPLVARNPRVQAAVARLVGEKYDVAYDDAPGIRAALGLDERPVREAYERLNGEPLDAIFARRVGLRERIRWAWARLAARVENLPPFWTVYALTLTETVGATILALPIALAAVGPLPGVVVLVALGLVNVVTVAFMAEAIGRSGPIRYGRSFLGRVVEDYLGRGGSFALGASLIALCLLVLPVFFIGFGRTLADATAGPPGAWVALLFVVVLYYLRRESLDATIASALVVGAVNVALVVVLSLVAFAHASGDNVLYADVPFAGSGGFDASLVALVFGVVLVAYYGHTSVAICGRLVLRRDPSGRSLLRGCVAAQLTAIALYCLFVVAVNGAVAPEVLAREAGTAVSPLAEVAGPAVHVLGAAFVVLGLGMGAITFGLATFGLVLERLPSASSRVLLLPRRDARLLLAARPARRGGAVDMALVYLGLHDGEPRFRLDVGQGARSGRLEAAVARRWDVFGPRADAAVAGRFPALADGRARLVLEVLEADDRSARIRIDSTLRLAYDGAWDTAGLGLADVLTLSDREAEVAAWLLRAGEGGLRDVAERTGLDAAEVRDALAALVERGVVGETNSTGESRYVARPVARRGGRLPRDVARALVEPDAAPARSARDTLARAFRRWGGMRSVVAGRRARFAVAASPIVGTFAAAEWMAVTGSGSFAGLLNVVGTIVVSLLAGVFPVLLLVASRRKGQPLPAASYALLGNPLLLGAVYLLFLAGILLHGLVIWDEPLERAAALAAAVVVVALTGALAGRGLLARRLTIELREEAAAGHATFAVTAAGLPTEADVTFEYEDGETRVRAAAGKVPQLDRVRRATFEPRYGDGGAAAVSEVKVWAHRVTPDDDSEGLAARVAVVAGAERVEVDLAPSRGEAVLPVADRPGAVDVSLTGSPTTPPLGA